MAWLTRLLNFLERGRSVGARGERAAARYLRNQGYRLRARNLRSRLGEIDILAQTPDGKQWVVVEVKSRLLANGHSSPLPEEHVNRDKQRKLALLAAQLIKRHGLEGQTIRFDVIGVDLPARGQPRLRHHPAAFESHL